MSWKMRFTAFAPGGDADICWFFAILSRVCSIWDSERGDAPHDAKELTTFCSNCLLFYQSLMKEYSNELLHCVSDDCLKFIEESTSPNVIKLHSTRVCCCEMKINDGQFKRIKDRLEYFSALVKFQRRINSLEEYKIGNSMLSLSKEE